MKKNVVWMIVAVVVGILLAASTVLLAIGIGNLAMTQKRLNVLLNNWRSFYQLDPFPSEENIKRESENNARLEKWFGDMVRMLRRQQRDRDPNKSPTNFKTLLDQRAKAMADKAGGRVALPPNFGFGFDRYVATRVLPEPEDVPILTQQLFIMEELFNVLVDAGVAEITGMAREQFESGSQSGQTSVRRSGRGAGAEALPAEEGGEAAAPKLKPGEIPPGALYGKLHFILEFRAFEKPLLDVLNRLASHGMVMAVTDVKIEAEGTDLQKMVQAGKPKESEPSEQKKPRLNMVLGEKRNDEKSSAVKAGEGAAETNPSPEESGPPPRDQRIVCGQGKVLPMKVTVGVDVFVFRGD